MTFCYVYVPTFSEIILFSIKLFCRITLLHDAFLIGRPRIICILHIAYVK